VTDFETLQGEERAKDSSLFSYFILLLLLLYHHIFLMLQHSHFSPEDGVVSPKRWHLPSSLHGTKTQKNNIIIIIIIIIS
jgi:hypothetical protein